MLGLDVTPSDGPLYGELLPGLVVDAGIDAPYLPSAPWGGVPPFRPDRFHGAVGPAWTNPYTAGEKNNPRAEAAAIATPVDEATES